MRIFISILYIRKDLVCRISLPHCINISRNNKCIFIRILLIVIYCRIKCIRKTLFKHLSNRFVFQNWLYCFYYLINNCTFKFSVLRWNSGTTFLHKLIIVKIRISFSHFLLSMSDILSTFLL